MTRKTGAWVVVICLSVVAGCSRGSVADVMEADRALARATAEQGREGFLSFLADDVTYMPAGAPMLEGKEAMAERWEPFFSDPNRSITWEPKKGGISGLGELGYTIGQYEVTLRGEGGEVTLQRGKYMTLWRRTAEGWKVIADIGNTDGPPETGTAD